MGHRFFATLTTQAPTGSPASFPAATWKNARNRSSRRPAAPFLKYMPHVDSAATTCSASIITQHKHARRGLRGAGQASPRARARARWPARPHCQGARRWLTPARERATGASGRSGNFGPRGGGLVCPPSCRGNSRRAGPACARWRGPRGRGRSASTAAGRQPYWEGGGGFTGGGGRGGGG